MNEGKVTGNRCQILKRPWKLGVRALDFIKMVGKSWRDLGQGTDEVTFPF